MKTIFFVFMSVLSLAGCKEPTIDASSGESFKNSLVVVRQNIPDENLEIFDSIINETIKDVRFHTSYEKKTFDWALSQAINLSDIHGLNSSELFLKWKEKQENIIKNHEHSLDEVLKKIKSTKDIFKLIPLEDIQFSFKEVPVNHCRMKTQVICDELIISFNLTNNTKDLIYEPGVTITWGGNDNFYQNYFVEGVVPYGIMPSKTQRVELTIVNTNRNINIYELIQSKQFIVKMITLDHVNFIKPHLKPKLAQLTEKRKEYILAKEKLYELTTQSDKSSNEHSFSKAEILFIKSDWDDELKKIYKLVSSRISIREYNTEKSNTEHYMKTIRYKISSLPSSVRDTK